MEAATFMNAMSWGPIQRLHPNFFFVKHWFFELSRHHSGAWGLLSRFLFSMFAVATCVR